MIRYYYTLLFIFFQEKDIFCINKISTRIKIIFTSLGLKENIKNSLLITLQRYTRREQERKGREKRKKEREKGRIKGRNEEGGRKGETEGGKARRKWGDREE